MVINTCTTKQRLSVCVNESFTSKHEPLKEQNKEKQFIWSTQQYFVGARQLQTIHCCRWFMLIMLWAYLWYLCVVALWPHSLYLSRRKNRNGQRVWWMSTGRKNGLMWRIHTPIPAHKYMFLSTTYGVPGYFVGPSPRPSTKLWYRTRRTTRHTPSGEFPINSWFSRQCGRCKQTPSDASVYGHILLRSSGLWKAIIFVVCVPSPGFRETRLGHSSQAVCCLACHQYVPGMQ